MMRRDCPADFLQFQVNTVNHTETTTISRPQFLSVLSPSLSPSLPPPPSLSPPPSPFSPSSLSLSLSLSLPLPLSLSLSLPPLLSLALLQSCSLLALPYH